MATPAKTLMDFFQQPEAKRLKRVSSPPLNPLSSLKEDAGSASSMSSMAISPEQKRRMEYSKAVALSKRNLKLCYDRVSKAVATGVAYTKLKELLVEETWSEVLSGELRKPYAEKLCEFVQSEVCHRSAPIYPPQHLIFTGTWVFTAVASRSSPRLLPSRPPTNLPKRKSFGRMARYLANLIPRGRAAFPAVSPNASASFYQGICRFSTTVPNDPDTDEDFRPTTKVGSSDLSFKDLVEQDVKENPVMIYMKGIPDQPRCGFSALAVQVLKKYNIPLSSRNILEHEELKNAVKACSHWPTFPQIFINGEFIGGSDILLSMHQNDELKDKLKDIPRKEQENSSKADL